VSAKYAFGLDLGLNNVGWAVIEHGDNARIESFGTYVFNSPLTEDSDATSGLKSRDRGMKRRSRRTLKRRADRKKALYRLLAEKGFLPLAEEARVEMFCRHRENGIEVHPYALRAKALTEKLEPFHVGRVLCHLNQRRGFLSPRDLMLKGVGAQTDAKFDTDDEESGLVKGEIKQTREAMEGFPTIGAFLANRMRHGEPVRKKTKKHRQDVSKEELKQRFVRHDRAMLEKEFHAIWNAQSKHHPLLTPELKRQVEDLIFHQIPVGAQIGLRGKCIFFPEENRIAAASLTAQKYRIAQDLAHLQIKPKLNSEERPLSPAERQTLANLLMKGDDLSWTDAKSAIVRAQQKGDQGDDLSRPDAENAIELPTARFSVEPSGTKPKSGEKEKLKGCKTALDIRKVIGEKWDQLGPKGQENLVGILLTVQNDPIYIRENGVKKHNPKMKPAAARIYKFLRERPIGPNKVQLSESEAANLATLDLPKGYLNLSLKAIKKIMPHMLRDKVYSEACAAVGLNHTNPDATGEIFDLLEPRMAEGIRHPLVKCSVYSAIRVINQLIKRYGKPAAIRIELPRDLAKSAKQREEETEVMQVKEKIRKRHRELLAEHGIPINERNLKKVALWYECGTKLPYEPDVTIGSVKDLCESDIEIDHIVPRSHNFDNSLSNLALCTRDFNLRIKKDKCFYQAIQEYNPELWAKIVTHVKELKPDYLISPNEKEKEVLGKLAKQSSFKRQRILAKDLPEGGFTGRHLTATGYIAKEILAMVKHLGPIIEEVPDPETGEIFEWGLAVDVTVTQGSATGHLRGLWGLNKVVPLHPSEYDEEGKPKPGKSRSDYRHHAVDAVVIALTDRSAAMKVAAFYKAKELQQPDRKPIESPIPNLREQVEKMIPTCPVVHRPDRRASGQLHKETAETPGPETPGGKPMERRVVGNKLVCYDGQGRPAQAYSLGNNHHMVIWECLTPNKKGAFERRAEVVPCIEAVQRRQRKEAVIRHKAAPQGWRFVMSICKGDMVEMADGTIGVVSKFSAEANSAGVYMVVWRPYVAQQLGKVNPENPYMIQSVRSSAGLTNVRHRIVHNVRGETVFSEGLDD